MRIRNVTLSLQLGCLRSLSWNACEPTLTGLCQLNVNQLGRALIGHSQCDLGIWLPRAYAKGEAQERSARDFGSQRMATDAWVFV